MAANYFLRVTGGTGESKNSAYTGWTDCESVEWSIDQPSTIASGGGGGAAIGNFRELIVTATHDKVMPSIWAKCASGEHIPKVEVAGAKMGGTQMEYMKIELSDAMVSSCRLGSQKGDEGTIQYGFMASKVKISYWEQNKDGTKGAASEQEWDIKKNTK